jgi:hypothetical protein
MEVAVAQGGILQAHMLLQQALLTPSPLVAEEHLVRLAAAVQTVLILYLRQLQQWAVVEAEVMDKGLGH